MLKGFKDFISRGNVVELAVGVIIGAAFKNIVDALVNGIINPLIAAVIGKPDFSDAFILTLNGTDVKFGLLITAVINFIRPANTANSTDFSRSATSVSSIGLRRSGLSEP